MNDHFIVVFLTLTVSASGTFLGSSPLDPTTLTNCNETLLYSWYCDITCKIYGMCYNNPKIGYTFVPLEYCTDYCTSTGCSSTFDPKNTCNSNSGTITCKKEDIYPDPYDCRRSLHCSPKSGVSPCTVCTDEYYNSTTGSCGNKLKDGQCPTPIMQVCLYTGDTKAMVNDPRFFYTCMLHGKTLYPDMSKCPKGEYFDNTEKMCVKSSKNDVSETDEECNASTITTTDPSTIDTSTPPSTPPSTLPSTPPSTPPSTHICNKEGYVCDPKECHKYYYCDANLIPTHMICNPGKHCDTGSNTCVSGETCSLAGA